MNEPTSPAERGRHPWPPIGRNLARLRTQADLTQEQLAERSGVSVDLIRRLEQGSRASARLDSLYRLACALDVPLSELLVTLPPGDGTAGDPDDEERYQRALQDPERVDERVVGYLARVLAEHRRADDLFGPRGMLPPITGQLEVIQRFIASARPEVRQQVLSVACQYAQFLGWLYQDAGQHAKAVAWYGRAEEWALECGSLPMVATALSMKADLAMSLREPYRAASLAQAAQAARWRCPPGLRALCAQGEAGAWAAAYALAGDAQAADAARRKLDVVQRHVAAMVEGREPEAPWTYFFTPEFSRMQRAMVLRNLGDVETAIPLFEAGLAALGPGHRRERGQYLARLGFAYFLAGEREEALACAEEAASIAGEVGSIRTAEELQRFRAVAAERRAQAALRRLDELVCAVVELAGTWLPGHRGNGDAAS